jgi:hypothetical protein
MRRLCFALCVLVMTPSLAAAQQDRRPFAGALFGVSTLSADGRSIISPSDAALSLYKPENGLAVNAFAGVHLAEFFSLQANYMWNRNDVTLVSSLVTAQGGGFYEQRRHSAQHAVVADTLLYFRGRASRIRPYLGTGLSVIWFTSDSIVRSMSNRLAPPSAEFHSTKIALRSHVGIDIRLSPRLVFRYSFSETIGRNPISPHLTPPGQRRLANFQNLFGLAAQF